MLSIAEFFEASINKVKAVCNKFWTNKVNTVFTDELNIPDAPAIGLDSVDIDGEYTIEQEEYKAYHQVENVCMVVADIVRCDKFNNIKREYVNVMVMCQLQDEEIRFLCIHMSTKNKDLLVKEQNTTDMDYCKKLIDNIYDVMMETRGTVFTYDKEAYRKLFHEESDFKNIDQWFWYLCDHLVLKQDLEKLDVFRQVDIDKRISNKEYVIHTTFRIARECKEIIWLKMTIMFITDNNNCTTQDGVILLKDCTEEMNEKLQNIEFARMDALTKIYNRRYAEELIQKRIREYKKGCFVIFDVDRFKYVNDTYGHITGDDLLVKITSNILKVLTPGDVFGRLGGDEFVLFLVRGTDKDADRQRLMEIFETSRFHYSEKNIDMDIHCSAGAVFFEDGDIDFETLYDDADKAMYKAKMAGKNTIYIV